MTTIVAVKTETDIKFAWDSQVTWQGRAMLGCEKVFDNGPVTFGVAGSGRAGDILKHMDIPGRREYEPDFDNEHWIVTELVPAIVTAFQDVSAGGEGQPFDVDGHIILAVDGVIGYLASDLCWAEDASGIYAVGSGSDYAIGALEAGASVKKAVEVAVKWDLYSGGEVATKTIKAVKK